jgi:hypothetical protein
MPCRAVHRGQCLPRAHRGHCSRNPSRKWLTAKGCRHDRASEDAGRGALTTSLRSYAAGATLAFTMPLVPPALRCFHLVHSHLLWGMSTTTLAICSLDSGCLRLLPTSGLAGGFSYWEAVADRPAVPRSRRYAVTPCLLPSWSRPSGRRWEPPGPERRQ